MRNAAEPSQSEAKSAVSLDILRPMRIRVAVAWTAGVLSIALLLIQRQLRIVHPVSVPFIILLILAFGAALGALVRGLWRLIRGPRRRAAIAWAILGFLPPFFWLALGWYGMRQWGSRNVPHNLPFALMKMSGASLMEAQARYLYPHRLETDRLVMFYSDGVADPHGDAEAMDRHVARLEEMTGLPLRAKIWWVRGSLLGQKGIALGGLAIGSSKSPAEYVDRHELAHAVIYQGDYPDTDPPTLLMEGWAESQSVAGETLASRADGFQHQGRIDSYLRELTDPFWYHHDAGTVYPIGGAFVDFLLRRHGPQPFVKLYFTVRPGTFEIDCQRIYGIDLDTLEAQFWEDVEQRVRDPRP